MTDVSGVEQWAGERWRRRFDLPDPEAERQRTPRLDVAQAVEISGPPGVVWELIGAPENRPRLDSRCVQGFTVKGTPRGAVGERQCFIHQGRDGTLSSHFIEVVEVVPGQRLVTTPVPGSRSRRTTMVAGSATRSILVVSVTGEAQSWESVGRMTPAVVAQLRAYVDRVKVVIEELGRS